MRNIPTFVLLALIISCRSHPKSESGEVLPAFDLLLADSTTRINTGTIREGQRIVVLYFSPDCEHCQQETESIIHHINDLKDVQFYFVTIDPFERMQAFNGYYKLDNYPNITVGKDEQFFLLRHFKDAFPPYLILYDRQKRQRRVFTGETKIDTLIQSIDQL